MGGPREMTHRLDHACLVVCAHDAHEGAAGVYDLAEELGRDHAGAVTLGEPDLKAAVMQHGHEVQDGVVLDGGENHTRALAIALVGAARQAEKCQIVGLGAA